MGLAAAEGAFHLLLAGGGGLATKSTRAGPDAPGVTAGAGRRDAGQEAAERASADGGAAGDRGDSPAGASRPNGGRVTPHGIGEVGKGGRIGERFCLCFFRLRSQPTFRPFPSIS